MKKQRENICPLESYVKFIFSYTNTVMHLEVFCQKSANSDEFICVDQQSSPLGQDLIDFISISNERLPPLVEQLKNYITMVQGYDFDHHRVPPHIHKIYELYKQIASIHPVWYACMHLQEFWRYMNDYSYISIHPSPYLIETYDEVDRLIDEESCLLAITDLLNKDLRLLEAYVRCLESFEHAMAFCLEGVDAVKELSALKRAYVFQTYFDNLFLNNETIYVSQCLQPLYVSPLGMTVSRSEIECKQNDKFLGVGLNDMIYEDVVSGANPALSLPQLINMVKDKEVEFTSSVVLHDLPDIYAMCSFVLSKMLLEGARIRKCKSCGRYFVPLNRSDEQYCYRKNASGKMCREQSYSAKINSDNYLIAYRTAYKTHNARKQRNRSNRINAEDEFEQWVTRAKQLLRDARAGLITYEDYQKELKK